MKYDHIVKVNGEYYPAGTEIPANKEKREEMSSPPVSDADITLETEPVRRGRPKKN